jgi:hypothetical protein
MTGKCLSQHFCEFSALAELLHVSPTADELSVDEDSWHAASASHLTEDVLDLVAVWTIFQFNREEVKVDLLELLQTRTFAVNHSAISSLLT